MKNFTLGISMVVILLFTSIQALAGNMYGVLMVVKGTVKVTTASKQSSDGKVGGKVYEGDKVTTGADSRVKIVMSDRNVINVNPDSEMVIAKYENDPASGKKNVELNLLKGKVRNNVEQTYDGEKSKFLIKTPTAVAGVRGTQFLASYDVQTKMSSVATFKGAVTFASTNSQGQVIGSPVVVKKGEMTQASPNKAAEIPKAVPKEDMKKMDGESTAANAHGKETAAEAGGNASATGEQKREVAAEVAPAAPGSSMLGAEDVNPTSQVIALPQAQATPPPTTMATPPPTLPTPVPVLSTGSTKVNVRPVPKN